MRAAYRHAMDALYVTCVTIAGVSMVVMAIIIPYGVFMRYVVNAAAAWPEPLSILLMIVFTFLGGAACYRANVHIAVEIFVGALPAPLQRIVRAITVALLALVSFFMVYWGTLLVQATWHQVIAEFAFLRTGITYLPIPLGGAITLFFIFEQVWLGPPPKDSVIHSEPISAD